MKYNPEIHKRRSIRLKEYDYSQTGLYFITICVQNRECLFGNIEKNELLLNDVGKMVETEWLNLKNRFTNIELHEYISMPNHFHGILETTPQNNEIFVGVSLVDTQNDMITNDVDNKNEPNNHNGVNNENDFDTENGQPQGIAPTNKTIGDMMDAFKSITTVEYIRGVKNWGWKPFNGKLWQRNYYEHIIRNEESYQNISNYILANPEKWKGDRFYTG